MLACLGVTGEKKKGVLLHVKRPANAYKEAY
jgi:hypothetical protein